MIYIVWEACLDVSKAASYQETQKVSQFMRELEKNAIKLISAFQIRIQDWSSLYSQNMQVSKP